MPNLVKDTFFINGVEIVEAQKDVKSDSNDLAKFWQYFERPPFALQSDGEEHWRCGRGSRKLGEYPAVLFHFDGTGLFPAAWSSPFFKGLFFTWDGGEGDE